MNYHTNEVVEILIRNRFKEVYSVTSKGVYRKHVPDLLAANQSLYYANGISFLVSSNGQMIVLTATDNYECGDIISEDELRIIIYLSNNPNIRRRFLSLNQAIKDLSNKYKTIKDILAAELKIMDEKFVHTLKAIKL
jgi:vacuolar-type H+-ATPase subunit I/STV1